MGGCLNLAKKVPSTPGLGGPIYVRGRAHGSDSGEGQSHLASHGDTEATAVVLAFFNEYMRYSWHFTYIRSFILP